MINGIVGTSYTSEDADLVAVENNYAALETDLQRRIDTVSYTHLDVYKRQVLVNNITVADNLHSAIFSLAAYTVILCFSLFKSGALAKSIFAAH